MLDPDKIMLKPEVDKATQAEHEKIRAELKEKGPAFDFTSIKSRLKQAADEATAKLEKKEETDGVSVSR